MAAGEDAIRRDRKWIKDGEDDHGGHQQQSADRGRERQPRPPDPTLGSVFGRGFQLGINPDILTFMSPRYFLLAV